MATIAHPADLHEYARARVPGRTDRGRVPIQGRGTSEGRDRVALGALRRPVQQPLAPP